MKDGSKDEKRNQNPSRGKVAVIDKVLYSHRVFNSVSGQRR